MAQPAMAPEPAARHVEPSFDVLRWHDEPWTAPLALELLPETNDVIDRPREYAAAGVPFFLRGDLRDRVPTLALFELVEGEYRPLAAAAAGTTFQMTRPFAFSVDPADLLDDEAPAPTAEHNEHHERAEPARQDEPAAHGSA